MKKKKEVTLKSYLKLIAFVLIVCALISAKVVTNNSIDKEYYLYKTYADLPKGYTWDGENDRELESIREPTQDEINITREYFRIAETYVGKFPLEFIDARDAQPINVTATNNQGVSSAVKLEELNPSIPRYGNRLSEQIDNAIKRGITTCDKPSAIFRDMKNIGCMPGSRIKRVSNDSIDWVYIARKNNKFFSDENLYNEFGLIAYNRNSGKTVFFPGQAAARYKVKYKDSVVSVGAITGKNIPPPDSEKEESVKHWSIPMGGSKGGSCIECHSSGPFISFPFTDFKEIDDNGKPTYYREKDGKPTVPTRTPGMVYDPLNYISNKDFISFMSSYQTEDGKDNSFYDSIKKEVGKSEKFEPKRLTNKETQVCTTCHHIGNGTYIQRFPDAAFHLKNIDNLIDWNKEKKEKHERAYLYLKNISPDLAKKPNRSKYDKQFNDWHVNKDKEGNPILFPMLGFHNRKVLLRSEMKDFYPEQVDKYQKALAFMKKGLKNNKEFKWENHWTLDKVKNNPLSYLREQCSSCHDENRKAYGNKPSRKLWDKDDFLKDGASLSRIKNKKSPMPTNGQFQESVLKILETYLEN